MAGKVYQFDNPGDVEELQQMLLESNDENDRVKCKNKSDLEDEDYVQIHSEDSDTKQDISRKESEDELHINEEYTSKMSHLSKYLCKCCEKYLCLEYSNIVSDGCYKHFAKPTIEDSD